MIDILRCTTQEFQQYLSTATDQQKLDASKKLRQYTKVLFGVEN